MTPSEWSALKKFNKAPRTCKYIYAKRDGFVGGTLNVGSMARKRKEWKERKERDKARRCAKKFAQWKERNLSPGQIRIAERWKNYFGENHAG